MRLFLIILLSLHCQPARANLPEDMVKMVVRAEQDSPDVFGRQRVSFSLTGSRFNNRNLVDDEVIATYQSTDYVLALDYRARLTRIVTPEGVQIHYPVFMTRLGGTLPKTDQDFYGQASVDLGYTFNLNGFQLTPTAGALWYRYYRNVARLYVIKMLTFTGGLQLQAYRRSGTVFQLSAIYSTFENEGQYIDVKLEAGKDIKLVLAYWDLFASDDSLRASSKTSTLSAGLKFSF